MYNLAVYICGVRSAHPHVWVPGNNSAAASSSKPLPNVVTFNILMDHYSGLGQWEKCRRTLQDRMRAVR